MGTKFAMFDNVVITHWYDQITVKDVDEIFEVLKNAHKRNGAMTGVSILGPRMERPQMDVLNRMHALHPQMCTFQASSHYVMLIGGFLASGIMANVTRLLTQGTGGNLFFHKTVRDALTRGGEYQRSVRSHHEILMELKRKDFPLE
ncbi:hypothetical protein IT407_03845 [Candidatus Uhrbacteria bacterium]|nr:hypothetical protein [Candidatus Uhrbacteria bacterium]